MDVSILNFSVFHSEAFSNSYRIAIKIAGVKKIFLNLNCMAMMIIRRFYNMWILGCKKTKKSSKNSNSIEYGVNHIRCVPAGNSIDNDWNCCKSPKAKKQRKSYEQCFFIANWYAGFFVGSALNATSKAIPTALILIWRCFHGARSEIKNLAYQYSRKGKVFHRGVMV